jgi:hypothetical protein
MSSFNLFAEFNFESLQLKSCFLMEGELLVQELEEALGEVLVGKVEF